MLASLEGGGGDETIRISEKERATIESTIEMTDAVVAEKDAVIADLKAQLAAGVVDKSTSAGSRARAGEVNELLDSDDVIAEHRSKTAQLEQEMEGKLRAAELELSVERAKIARNGPSWTDCAVELESQRHAQGTATNSTPTRHAKTPLALQARPHRRRRG